MDRRLVLLLASVLTLAGCPDAHGATDVDGGNVDAATDDAGDHDGGGGSEDTGPGTDAGPFVPTCDAMDARIDVCAVTCDDVSGAFWDGTTCVPSHCDCTGAECGVYASVAACEADHGDCDATLCASTGGAWFNRPEWCGHFVCGFPNPDSCAVPTPACDCGTYRVFDPGTGCTDGPLCELTAPVDPDVLCASTGGEWMVGICGDARCGRLSDLDCALPGCVCGALEIFDTERGCIRSPSCDVRLLDESCDDTRLCGGGSVCCANGGISTASTCSMPMCADPSGPCGPPRP